MIDKTTFVTRVRHDNRRRMIQVTYSRSKRVEVHYGQIGIGEKISKIWIDSETKGRSIVIQFEDGRVEYMPYDQPLAIARDAEFMLQNHIERLIARIREAIASKRISKRFLAHRLETSANQIQRLLNPRILNKNLAQLYKLAALAGLELEWRVAAAA